MNPIGDYWLSLSVDGDAQVLALVFICFQGSEEEVGGGLIPPGFSTHVSTAGRFLGWDAERYKAAFQKLLDSGELVTVKEGSLFGYRLLGWDRLEAELASYGQRTYWRRRKRAKKAVVNS